MSKNIAEIVAETLEQAGAKRCYGVPGDTLNHFTDAIRKSSIRWVHVRHEEVGAFAAGAEAFLTDNLTLCAGSCGPGSLHFINGLFESHRNKSPVVLIASQVVEPQLGTDFPQEVDFRAVYRTASVFCDQISTVAEAQRKTSMAAQAALEKKGVAVLVLPANIAKEKADTGELTFGIHRSRPVIRPNEQELREMAELINQGGKITIYGGIGCEDAHDEIMTLAQKIKAPVAHSSRAKDFLGYDNPNNAGLMGAMGHYSGCYAVAQAETLLLLGTDFAWSQFYPKRAKIIQVDTEATHLGRRHPIHLGLVGNVKDTVQALLPLVEEQTDDKFLDHCRQLYQKSVDQYNQHAQPTKDGLIRPQYLTSIISRLAAEDAVFTADGGSPMVWLLRHIDSTSKRRTLASLKHGTMANAMPQALGAKVAFPDRQVISLSGDGGFSMLMGDILTAVQESIPIKVVVFNNSSLFFVELEQRAEGLLDTYTDLKNPSFASVVQAAGWWGKEVQKCDELETAVQEWLNQPGPALLDVKVGKEITMPPSVEFEQLKGMGLYALKAIIGGREEDLLELIKDNF